MAPVPYEATPPPLDAKEVTMAVDSAIASVRSDFRVEFCTAVVTRAKALQKKFENDGTWMQILRDKLKVIFQPFS